MATISAVPDERTLESHRLLTVGQPPTTKHVVEFLYPRHIRRFDGAVWTVVDRPDRLSEGMFNQFLTA